MVHAVRGEPGNGLDALAKSSELGNHLLVADLLGACLVQNDLSERRFLMAQPLYLIAKPANFLIILLELRIPLLQEGYGIVAVSLSLCELLGPLLFSANVSGVLRLQVEDLLL